MKAEITVFGKTKEELLKGLEKVKKEISENLEIKPGYDVYEGKGFLGASDTEIRFKVTELNGPNHGNTMYKD